MLQKIFHLLLVLLSTISMTGCETAARQTETCDIPALPTAPAVVDSIPQENVEQEQTMQEAAPVKIVGLDISLDYTRMSTSASNQFAVWIEDKNGAIVKTLFVPNFTASRRGYRNRDMSLSAWVKATDPESMSDTEIDAISGATPETGRLVYSWDMTDTSGERVPDGIYTIKIEGTLFWESSVLYTAELDTADTMGGELPVTVVRSEPDNKDNETMIEDVRVSVVVGA